MDAKIVVIGLDMYPEDRVLVAVMSRPQDFEIARDQGWYRVPERKAGRGLYFEYVAFYFTAAFGEEKWTIHYYAPCLGHELVTRRDMLPDEPDHSRAGELYYKLQLGPLQKREPAIISHRWRRVTFIYTTWDRFQAAKEINDLYAQGGEYVDRLYHALRDAGLAPERHYPVREQCQEYIAGLALPCREGVLTVGVAGEDADPPSALSFTPEALTKEPETCLQLVRAEVERRGGIQPWPPQEGKDGPP
jgi:hypothetical protein